MGLPRRISFAGITRNANRLQEEYVVEELAQVQLYARRWPPPSPNAPPFYVVTCFPTKRPPNMGIDDWGDDRIIGSSLFQQFHDVQHVQDNTNEGLRQRAEAYALWLQNNLANVGRNDGSKFAVAKVIPGPSTQLDFCPFKGRFLGTAPRRFAAQAAGAKAARITARKTRGRFSNTSV